MVRLSVLVLLWGIALGVQAQELKGKVIAESGALKGASILVDGVAKVQTDEVGMFSLVVQKMPFRLSVRSVGYAELDTLIASLPRVPLLLRLQARVAQLEEVKVSTGYQQLSAEKLAGSYDVVGKQRYNEQVGTNVLERLEGVASSLSVDRKTNFGIRGTL